MVSGQWESARVTGNHGKIDEGDVLHLVCKVSVSITEEKYMGDFIWLFSKEYIGNQTQDQMLLQSGRKRGYKKTMTPDDTGFYTCRLPSSQRPGIAR